MTIKIIVRPSRTPDGRRAHNGRGQLFDAVVDGRLLVASSTTPFIAAARRLASEGVALDTRIEQYHEDRPDVLALSSTVATASRRQWGQREPQRLSVYGSASKLRSHSNSTTSPSSILRMPPHML
jgi:hypothetical protein